MSDDTNRVEGMDGRDETHGEAIARLIRLAGPRPAVPVDRARRVRAAVHEHWRATVRSGAARRRWFWLAGALAAAATLVLALGPGREWLPGVRMFRSQPQPTLVRVAGTVLWPGRTQPAVGEVLPGRVEIETGNDGLLALRLADGGSMRADHATRLRLESSSLIHLERGALYIDSGPAPRRSGSVEIRTMFGRVRDIGTQFQVRVGDDGMDVTVRQGLADLRRDDRSYRAAAGTQLRVDASGAVDSRDIAASAPEWDWVLRIAPDFDIEGRTLGEFLAWVARETGRRVDFANPAIAPQATAVVLHGSIAGLSPLEAPAAVLPTCGLEYRVQGDTIVIRSPEGAGRNQ